MKIKEILIGLGVIGAGVIGYKVISKDSNESPVSSSGASSGVRETSYNPIFDFSNLFKDDQVASPSRAFSQTENAVTKKEASTSSSSGYASINSGKSINNIFNKVSSSSPDRFAFNSLTGGIIDLSTQQSITRKELNKRLENPVFTKTSITTKKLEATR